MRISVFAAPQLAAAILGLKNLERTTRTETRKAVRQSALPIWRSELERSAATPLQQAVLVSTGRVAVSDQNVTLRSAHLSRRLSGGGKPVDLAAGAEFGSKHHPQFGTRNRKGKVAYPAAARAIPRLAALYVQTIVRSMHDALEGK